MLIVGTIDR
jgi:hypothetical protein